MPAIHNPAKLLAVADGLHVHHHSTSLVGQTLRLQSLLADVWAFLPGESRDWLADYWRTRPRTEKGSGGTWR